MQLGVAGRAKKQTRYTDEVTHTARLSKPLPTPVWVEPLQRALQRVGAEGYVVGGALRDLLLGRPPRDWDVLVRADELGAAALAPALQTALAPAPLLQVGESFAVFKLKLAGEWLDVALPTNAAGQQDPRLSLQGDLARRDFSANAVALPLPALEAASLEGLISALIDPFGGVQAIQAGQLCATTSATASLEADPLRIVRAARFYATLGLKPDAELTRAASNLAGKLMGVAPERIWREWVKLLGGKQAAAALRWLERVGALEVLLPAWSEVRGLEQHNPHHSDTVSEHILQVVARLDAAGADPLTKLAGLLHDIGKGRTRTLEQGPQGVCGHFYGHEAVGADMAQKWLGQLRASRDEARKVTRLVRLHMRPNGAMSRRAARRLVRDAGEDLEALLALHRADRLAHTGADAAAIATHLQFIRDSAGELPRAFSDHDLALSGRELMALGLRGAEIGQAKRRLVAAVVDEEVPNEAAALRGWWKQHGGLIPLKDARRKSTAPPE